MSRVVVLQSNYIPWKGYFDLIHDADTFIFYDDVQFTHSDWRNRNKILMPGGLKWLTIPTGTNLNRLIHEVVLKDAGWQARHWEAIRQSYRKAPYFSQYRDFFEHYYLGNSWSSLSVLNQNMIRGIARELLGIRTRFDDSCNYELSGRRQDRLLELLGKCGARSYISGPAAKSYLEQHRFDAAGIELVWKDYSGYPPYQQQGSQAFEHGVSILDLLFNVGPAAPYYIWGWREGAPQP